ncbi:hypothetical protein AB0I84_43275 [Streptomyces spectabilis]|uniref:hypothetical protein n=1 Tax=Streptomyces spectabilis TaxID=68270 RepID=UPI003404F3C7
MEHYQVLRPMGKMTRRPVTGVREIEARLWRHVTRPMPTDEYRQNVGRATARLEQQELRRQTVRSQPRLQCVVLAHGPTEQPVHCSASPNAALAVTEGKLMGVSPQ